MLTTTLQHYWQDTVHSLLGSVQWIIKDINHFSGRCRCMLRSSHSLCPGSFFLEYICKIRFYLYKMSKRQHDRDYCNLWYKTTTAITWMLNVYQLYSTVWMHHYSNSYLSTWQISCCSFLHYLTGGLSTLTQSSCQVQVADVHLQQSSYPRHT